MTEGSYAENCLSFKSAEQVKDQCQRLFKIVVINIKVFQDFIHKSDRLDQSPFQISLEGIELIKLFGVYLKLGSWIVIC